MKLSLYLTDDLFFYEEQIKEWRRTFTDVTIVTELSADKMHAVPNLLGETLTVIRQDKLPSVKKMDFVKGLLSEHMDVDNVVVFFTKASRSDKNGVLAKLFPNDRVRGMYSLTDDQKEQFMVKNLPWIPPKEIFNAVEAAREFDTRTFRSKVLHLAEVHADEAMVRKEFPRISKGAVFGIAALVEKGTPEDLARALRALRDCRLAGDDPMMVLGALHRTYRLSYKLAIHPKGRDAAVKELGLSNYQARDIPVLSKEAACEHHGFVSSAVSDIKNGRDGFDAIASLISLINRFAADEKGGNDDSI